MKTIRSILLSSITFLFITSACDIIQPGKNEPNLIKHTLKSAEIIESDQLFAFELFKEVCSNSAEENIMISPLSVSYALGMTYNGAKGTTLDAFNDVLHFGNLTNQEVNETYMDLMGQIIRLDDNVELVIANSIWYKEDADVLKDFIKTNEDYFDAAVKELDFSDPKSVDIINDWIEKKTDDKIHDMLDIIPSDAYMYLINAIYFNANWRYVFDPNDTYSGYFHLEGGDSKRVDFMKINREFYYTYTEDYSAVELPYGDSAFSMVAILPTEDSSLNKLIAKLDLETWNKRSDYTYSRQIRVELPKFSFDFKKENLKDDLSNLGLAVAFSDSANFSRITTEVPLYISRVIHQTFIDVSEQGTEAAAATIVEAKQGSIFPSEPSLIRFSRPFLYIIKENSTDAIMFMGKVGNP